VKILLTASLILWLFAVGFGTFYLAGYENTPGKETSSHPVVFPPQSRIGRDAEVPTLLVFAHPHCPCTRATIRELAKLMTEAQGRLRARVLFIKPANFSDDWVETNLWNDAAAIPGVEVARDDEGREAALFSAETSGITLLYDSDGNLLFQGGITASRGHEGDNEGRSSIVDFVTKDAARRAETSVYGCPLKNPQNCPEGLN
jgi:hypothetical protein